MESKFSDEYTMDSTNYIGVTKYFKTRTQQQMHKPITLHETM